MYISDVISRVAAGDLEYSPHNQRKVLGSLRRCAVIYDAPAERIPANLDLFDARWDRGKVRTFPLAHFTCAKQFRDWRSNVRGAIAQATGARDAARARRASNDGYCELLSAFDALAEAGLFNKAQRVGLEWIADCGRREGVDSADITIAHIMRWRETYRVTSNQKALVARYLSIFDRLHKVPGIGHLLPPAPLGQLPKKRANGERLAAVPVSFRAEWTRWRDTYRRGKPSPLSGSTKPKSNGYMGQFDAALAWYLESIEKLRLADITTLDGVRASAHPAWLQAASRLVLADYDEDGDPLDDHVTPRLTLGSLQTYLERLKTVFDEFGCAVAARKVAELLEDRLFLGLEGMTDENIAFCKAIVTSVSRQAAFFQLPWTLQAKAEKMLARWDQLTASERLEAVRAGACAVAMLIFTRAAPIRIGNLAAIPYTGARRWLSEPVAGQPAVLLIPARFVKTGKEIRAPLQNAGRRDSWSLVRWYLKEIRPRMIDGSVEYLAAIDGPALFPGETGTLGAATLRDWIKIETAAAGLPMRPHQARHAVASILLNRHPDKLALIAALLGDTVATVERRYAWLDREKLVADAQSLIPTAAQILRGARRG